MTGNSVMASIARSLKFLFIICLAGAAAAACQPRGKVTDTPVKPQSLGKELPAGQPVKVGMLLPLSGNPQLAEVGMQMRNAAEMAIFETPDNSVKLIIKDSGTTPDAATAAAQAALQEGAQLLLGPLLRTQVRSVSAVGNAAKVAVVGFSNDLNQLDGSVFLMGNAPEAQAKQIVNYAAAKGLTKIGVLAPDDALGKAFLSGAQIAAGDSGAAVSSAVLYPPTAADLGPQIRSLSSDVTAIFLPDQPGRLVSLGPQLAQNGFATGKVRYLGTSYWNDPATLVGVDSLVGSWFPAPQPEPVRAFDARYQAAYGVLPVPIAAVAYDAVTMAGTLVERERNSQVDVTKTVADYWIGLDPTAIRDPQGFEGVEGRYRFEDNGAIDRQLAIYEIAQGGFVVVAPASGSFEVASSF